MAVMAMVVIWAVLKVSQRHAVSKPTVSDPPHETTTFATFIADEGLSSVPSFDHTDSRASQIISLENDYVMLSAIFVTGYAAHDYGSCD